MVASWPASAPISCSLLSTLDGLVCHTHIPHAHLCTKVSLLLHPAQPTKITKVSGLQIQHRAAPKTLSLMRCLGLPYCSSDSFEYLYLPAPPKGVDLRVATHLCFPAQYISMRTRVSYQLAQATAGLPSCFPTSHCN